MPRAAQRPPQRPPSFGGTRVDVLDSARAIGTQIAPNRNKVISAVSFGQDGQPEYQIEIHLGGCAGLTLPALDAALAHVQGLLSASVA